MAIYDKELIINGKAVRSPEQQVYKNMKDIEVLQAYIKEAYRTNDDVSLNIASISVAKSLTNCDEDVTSGWLLDKDANLFKITGGDEDSLLLDFYSSLRGPQGEDGAAVNIDDNITSATKVWSSLKTSNEITGLIDDSTPSASKVWSSSKVSSLLSDGIYWTSSEPTLVGSEYRISGDIYCGSDLINPSGTPGQTDNVLKTGDMIAYVDNDGKIASIWYYVSGSSPKIVVKVGDIGGGNQQYEHNIVISRAGFRIYGKLTNNDPTQYNSYQAFINAIKDDYNAYNKLLDMHGLCNVSNTRYNVCGVDYEGTLLKYYYLNYDSGQTAILQFGQQINESGTDFEDNVRTL